MLPHVLLLADKVADTSSGLVLNSPVSSTLSIPLCGFLQHPPCNGEDCAPRHFHQHHHLMALQFVRIERPPLGEGNSTLLVYTHTCNVCCMCGCDTQCFSSVSSPQLRIQSLMTLGRRMPSIGANLTAPYASVGSSPQRTGCEGCAVFSCQLGPRIVSD